MFADMEYDYIVLIAGWNGEQTYHVSDRKMAVDSAKYAVQDGTAVYSCVYGDCGQIVCEFEN